MLYLINGNRNHSIPYDKKLTIILFDKTLIAIYILSQIFFLRPEDTFYQTLVKNSYSLHLKKLH